MEFSDKVKYCSGGEWDRIFTSADYKDFIVTWLENTRYLIAKAYQPFNVTADMKRVRSFISQDPFMLGAYCYRSQRYGNWKRLSLRDNNRCQWYLQYRLFRQIIIAWINYRDIAASPYSRLKNKVLFYVELSERGLDSQHMLDLIYANTHEKPSEYDLERIEKHGLVYRHEGVWYWRSKSVELYMPQLLDECKKMQRGLAPSVSVRQ